MLRQIEYGVQNGPIIENEVLLIATLYLGTFVWVQEFLIKAWFDVATTQMFIFKLLVIDGVLFEAAFSIKKPLKLNMSSSLAFALVLPVWRWALTKLLRSTRNKLALRLPHVYNFLGNIDETWIKLLINFCKKITIYIDYL